MVAEASVTAAHETHFRSFRSGNAPQRRYQGDTAVWAFFDVGRRKSFFRALHLPQMLQGERRLGQGPDCEPQKEERVVISGAAVEMDLVTSQTAVY